MRVLPRFKGYTVDYRLGEFRRVFSTKRGVIRRPIEFIPFDSPKGRRLLRQLLRAK